MVDINFMLPYIFQYKYTSLNDGYNVRDKYRISLQAVYTFTSLIFLKRNKTDLELFPLIYDILG